MNGIEYEITNLHTFVEMTFTHVVDIFFFTVLVFFTKYKIEIKGKNGFVCINCDVSAVTITDL